MVLFPAPEEGDSMALSNKEASIVLGMLARGDHNHDIAAWFGENPGRIAEIKDGSHGAVVAAPSVDLPPKGAVGPKAQRLRAYARDALGVLQAKGAAGVDEAIKELQDGLKRFDTHST
jgi:hypothetical protein